MHPWDPDEPVSSVDYRDAAAAQAAKPGAAPTWRRQSRPALRKARNRPAVPRQRPTTSRLPARRLEQRAWPATERDGNSQSADRTIDGSAAARPGRSPADVTEAVRDADGKRRHSPPARRPGHHQIAHSGGKIKEPGGLVLDLASVSIDGRCALSAKMELEEKGRAGPRQEQKRTAEFLGGGAAILAASSAGSAAAEGRGDRRAVSALGAAAHGWAQARR